jgi:4-amino-4-deoxy-L-arabinose transferase-like glycosyltransferase
MKGILQKWGLAALTLLTFFVLLGSRALNEPDEGRYSEAAREMLQTGNWLVPHLWYLPHLDKPPMTYWLVAASMKTFGQNEWAVRLPVALAGISGVWAAFALGCAIGGRRAGLWSALILQTSLIYFITARMLTPDIVLTQFVAWAMYFFWRSWQVITDSGFRTRTTPFFLWHLAGWIATALGFLTKGPIALAIPLVTFGMLAFFRRRNLQHKTLFSVGVVAGILVFFALAAPWFLAVFQRVPQSAHYMILGQAAGHLLGTTIKNRPGGPLYFFGVLAVGLLPWTFLLGWLWRQTGWGGSSDQRRDGWLVLNIWIIFTFVLFSLSHAKLPAYILPIFPALAVLLALRFFGGEHASDYTPRWTWHICLAGALLSPAAFPLLVKIAFHIPLPEWLKWQGPVVVFIAIVAVVLARKWKWQSEVAFTLGLAWIGMMTVAAEIPMFESNLRDNQTLKPLGVALRENYRPGDLVVCWGNFPQGLPFYTGSVITGANRPYMGGMDMAQVPFEFPGNRERLGNLLLPDGNALEQLLAGPRRVWVVGFGNTVESIQQSHSAPPLHLAAQAGQWRLFTNR